MIKKTLIILGIALLGQSAMSNVANAATDWTPYFESMQNGCEFPDPREGVPSKYKASIVSNKVKSNLNDIGDDDDKIITTYTLKNATAFGQPMTKFEYLQGYEWSQLKLYFKNEDFIKLRPRFKLPELDEPSVVTKNDNSGYDVDIGGIMYLEFDKKGKSIACGFGI
ncbi:MAG: hypothetical protein Q4P13_12100 [Psychrobacter sp.]|nr:hypothetical protein [Psychrobacter sp.]